ncbi:MAG: hypothetical protein NUW21_08070 [Elusimicrobia bacterium]|nr:hypothetical protein [Elusimicrobiota bacterium]
MMFLLLSLALAGAVPASATCFPDSGCRLGCCEQTGMDAPCWCSACCQARAPDDIAVIYRDQKSAAFVYRHRVEFYDLKGLTPALLSEEGSVRPLRDDAEARGRPVLTSKDGRRVEVKPRSVLSFKDGIYPFAVRRSRVRAFIVCTAPEWGVSESSGAAASGFCGALRLDGKEVFRLPDGKAPSLLREPVGLSEDAKEALFALTKKRADGAREIVGYRLWREKKGVESLTPDGARAKALVEQYEGPFLLPSQQRGTGGH